MKKKELESIQADSHTFSFYVPMKIVMFGTHFDVMVYHECVSGRVMNYQEIVERLPTYQEGESVTIKLESGEDKRGLIILLKEELPMRINP